MHVLFFPFFCYNNYASIIIYVIVTSGRGSCCEECNSGTQLVTGTAQTITQIREPIQGSVHTLYSSQTRAYKKENKATPSGLL